MAGWVSHGDLPAGRATLVQMIVIIAVMAEIFESSLVELPKLDLELLDIEELRGEQNYFDRIKRIKGEDKLWKVITTFPTSKEAEQYINQTPASRHDRLSNFIPETEYLIQEVADKFTVIAKAKEVHGERLDQVDISKLDDDVLKQLDTFLNESLLIFENKGVCPGINLKNFIISEDRRLYYVDSQPYPAYDIEPFEMAHAREQRLIKVFGQEAAAKLPLTWGWISLHQVENYKKEKGVAKKQRKLRKII